MNIVIPPLIFYLLGAALVLGGAVRALTLGRRDPKREIADDDPARSRGRRRHLTFGIVWMLMGLFLIASTAGVLRSKWGSPSDTRDSGGIRVERRGPAPDQQPPAASTPTIHLDPARPTSVEPPAGR
jgi:hypothetical protein